MTTPLPGVFEESSWPTSLPARVVGPGWSPTLHGYDVEEDLARHYGFAEIVLLSLTGEAPDAAVGRAFEVALSFLAPLDPGAAPAHATSLARLCAATTSSLHALAALALGEQARTLLEARRPLLAWLAADGARELPPGCRAGSEAERDSVRRLAARLAEIPFELPLLAHDPDRDSALLALLHGCGLRDEGQLTSALVFAQLPCVLAEAGAHRVGDLRSYPARLPDFRYQP